MARKTGNKSGGFTTPAGKKYPSQARNYGRFRIMVVGPTGKRRFVWRDEYEGGK
jgi:hypothetical protein